jgi:hypothetical protein
MSTQEAVRAAPDERAAPPDGSGDPVAAATADALIADLLAVRGALRDA